MTDTSNKLARVQNLVTDIASIKRNHYIPGTDNRENVVEHSLSVAVFSWRLYEEVKPPLDLSLVLKYAIAHDFLERGLKTDTNTYATKEEKAAKTEYEAGVLKKLSAEFDDFIDMTETVRQYDTLEDEESHFVWSADKLQALIMGSIDDWRCYYEFGVSYEQFCNKNQELLAKCSPYLKDIFQTVITESEATYKK